VTTRKNLKRVMYTYISLLIIFLELKLGAGSEYNLIISVITINGIRL
jgi:hypothetical protein